VVLALALTSGSFFRASAENAYVQHNLVSDLPGLAAVMDTNLVNPWGIAFSGSSPFWISDNHSGLSTLYQSTPCLYGIILALINSSAREW